MRRTADAKRRNVQFHKGDWVWLSTSNLPLKLGSRKLASKFTGPFTVDAIVAPEAYRLRLPAAWRVHNVFHSSQLKAVVGKVGLPAPILLEDQQEQFEVERIVDMHSNQSGLREFLVQQKGYNSFNNSWESQCNLPNCQEILRAFLKKH